MDRLLALPVALRVQVSPELGRRSSVTSSAGLNSRLAHIAMYSSYSDLVRPSLSSKGRGSPGLDCAENSRNHLGSLRAEISTLRTSFSISRGGITAPIWPFTATFGWSSPAKILGASAADRWEMNEHATMGTKYFMIAPKGCDSSRENSSGNLRAISAGTG